MRLNHTHAFTEWGFIGLLALLCSGLTVLQYRWTGEISRAETERLRSRTGTAAQNLAADFDATLTAYCTALTPDEGRLNDANRAQLHSASFQKWLSLRPKPIFQRVGIVVPGADAYLLLEQDQRSGTLHPLARPANWEKIFQHFENDVRGPFTDPTGLLFEIPIFNQNPAGDGSPPENEWVIFEIDTNYLRNVWLPDLVAKHLSVSGTLINDVVVRAIASPRTVLFSTTDTITNTDTPVTALLNRKGRSASNQRGPQPNCFWKLEVYPQSDSLEKLVNNARRKNFAVALLLNGMILLAGIALVQLTRRSRRLAEQQMNFVAGVSHELRTPLTVIRGAAHNLNRGVVTEREQIEKYSGLIIQHVEQLGDMIEQVLALAGAQKKDSVRIRQPVALADVLRDAINATAQETQAAKCQLQLELPPAMPVILGDAAALRRVFQNLIANAAKHGGSGQWIGIVAVADEDSHPPMVEIQVTDRGPGIPAYEQAAIFKPFVRGALAQAAQIRGNGLGLSLVKEIVEDHGGKISVRSEENHGATFSVRLPAANPEKAR